MMFTLTYDFFQKLVGMLQALGTDLMTDQVDKTCCCLGLAKSVLATNNYRNIDELLLPETHSGLKNRSV